MIIFFDILAIYMLFIIVSMIYESMEEVYKRWKKEHLKRKTQNTILSNEK